jgi:predicted nucleotidyltransferase
MCFNYVIEPRAHFSRFIFGSAVYSETPSDLDVAIIYDKRYVTIEEAIEYRRRLIKEMSRQNSLIIDSILLSKEEETEMSFLENAKYIEF